MSDALIEHYNAALDALQAGNAEAALQHVENALVEDARDSESWQLYILILNALGRTEDARNAEAKLAGLDLSASDRATMAAAAAMAAGDPATAAARYRDAIQADPGRVENHTGLALALLESGDPTAAMEAADEAIRRAPDDARAHYTRGRVLRLTGGDKSAALESLTRAVTLDPDLMFALYEQGMLLADAGRLEEALKNFETFLQANPGDPSATQAITQIRAAISQSR